MSTFKKELEKAASDPDAGVLFAMSQLFGQTSRYLSFFVMAFLFLICFAVLPPTDRNFKALAIIQALSFGLSVTSVWANYRATEIVLDR